MRWIWTFAAFVTLTCAACTSSGDGSPTSSGPASTPSVSVPVSPSTPATSTSHGGPPRPAQPSLPADVPKTGPNTKPGEKPPIMPLEATQHTPDGAKAFAEFFIKTIDWGYATTSSKYMRHYFHSRCDDCRAFADALDRARTAQHRFIGARITITKSVVARKPLVASAERTVLITFNILSFEEVTKTNKPVRADSAHKGEIFEVSIAWSSNRWIVRALAADPS